MAVSASQFRKLACALSGAVEGAHMGHPDFRVNGRIFASLSADERRGVVKLTPEDQALRVEQEPDVFAPMNGAWGRMGWTGVALANADRAGVASALVLAHRLVAQTKARPKSARTRRN